MTISENFQSNRPLVAVVGLGYVGLPLAIAISEKYDVIGFDKNSNRIQDLSAGIDHTNEVDTTTLSKIGRLSLTSIANPLKDADFIIVTVPTPVDLNNVPDLEPLCSASNVVGAHMKRGAIVIYESTVFPGATEDICVPILQRSSGMSLHKDFHVGYSPERVNPGDRIRKITDIVKVTSASSAFALDRIDNLYQSVIHAGTCRAPSIKVAEAAKVIENAQRDLNIAFMNELSKIFYAAGINTSDVLKVASTKWNFIPFTPGLVGGHCIGVDPYYLTNKAETLGYYPDLILTARRVNESMTSFVAKTFAQSFLRCRELNNNRNVLIFGATFKENCPDIRNSKVFDLFRSLSEYGFEPEIVDPYALPEEVWEIEQIRLGREPSKAEYAGVILAVTHDSYCTLQVKYFKEWLMPGGLFFDLKAIFDKCQSDFQL